MKFWDSSALVPLCLEEPLSQSLSGLAKSDGDIVVWWGSRVECISAFARRRRENILSRDAERLARVALEQLTAAWSEVLPTELLRLRAERLLRVHPLRAADALQLAASLLWAEESRGSQEFVSVDQNLREAAYKEGFRILPE